MASAAPEVEAVDFEPEEDDLMDEDGAMEVEGSSPPRPPLPRIKSAITGGGSGDFAPPKKTKGRGFREEMEAERNDRFAAKEFDSLISDGGPGPQRYKAFPTSYIIIKQAEMDIFSQKIAVKVAFVWLPLFFGFKLYLDGSSGVNLGLSGVDGIIRDVNAQVHLFFKGPIGITDSSQTETDVLVEGIKQAIAFNFLPLKVEGDQENTIRSVSSGLCPWHFIYLVARVRE